MKYPEALWRGSFEITFARVKPLLLILPLFLSNAFVAANVYIYLPLLQIDDPQFNKTLSDMHTAVWSRIGYGPSLPGVIYYSVMVFVAPILEEIVFTGFLVNIIAKRSGICMSLLIVPVLFGLMHVPAFGLGSHLAVLYLMSVIYIMIRVTSGSLFYALIGHWLINISALAPKWIVAAKYFSMG